MSGKGVLDFARGTDVRGGTSVTRQGNTQTHASTNAIAKYSYKGGEINWRKYWIKCFPRNCPSIGTWTRVRKDEQRGQVAAATSTYFLAYNHYSSRCTIAYQDMKTIWEKVTAAHVPSVSLGGSSTEAAVLYKASPRQTKHGMELEGRGAKTISSLNNGIPRWKHSHGQRSFFFFLFS